MVPNIRIQKFGGSSLADEHGVMMAADRIVRDYVDFNLAVVVSAPAGFTDSIYEASDALMSYDKELLAGAFAAGEQINVSLLSARLKSLGLKPVPMFGKDIPVRVSECGHTYADRYILEQAINSGSIPIIAGFQAIDKNGNLNIMTRGGSDESAIAVSLALEGECDIFTDVSGLFDIDPKISLDARKIEKITCATLSKATSVGTRVIQDNAIKAADRGNLSIRISKMTDGRNEGTLVSNRVTEDADTFILTHDKNNILLVTSSNASPSFLHFISSVFDRLSSGKSSVFKGGKISLMVKADEDVVSYLHIIKRELDFFISKEFAVSN